MYFSVTFTTVYLEIIKGLLWIKNDGGHKGQRHYSLSIYFSWQEQGQVLEWNKCLNKESTTEVLQTSRGRSWWNSSMEKHWKTDNSRKAQLRMPMGLLLRYILHQFHLETFATRVSTHWPVSLRAPPAGLEQLCCSDCFIQRSLFASVFFVLHPFWFASLLCSLLCLRCTSCCHVFQCVFFVCTRFLFFNLA